MESSKPEVFHSLQLVQFLKATGACTARPSYRSAPLQRVLGTFPIALP